MKNLHKIILVALFTLICFALPAATFFLMPKEAAPFSQNENRFLSAFIKPDLGGYATTFFNKSPNNIKNKQFMNGFDAWFADRFLLRENWIVLKNELEMLQGKTEINGVFIVDDKMLQSWRDDERGLNSDIDLTLSAVDEFARKMNDEAQAQSYIMLVPTAQEIYVDLLPANSQPGNQAALIKHCYDNLETLTSIGVMTYLSENSDRYIYYRTDHHWTTYGAYWGYYAAAINMGITPYELGRFNVEHAASNFRGTLFSKTLSFRVTPDVIQFYTLSSNSPYSQNSLRLRVNNGREVTEYDSLYLREFLEQKDKYAAFMGLNSPIMDVYTDIDNGKSLLLFKDSFAHCMIPFLANHYSHITVIDMRYINAALEEYIKLSDYKEVLFLYSATNFAEDNDLRKLY
ncbi:MAG: DHHW family protein [Oscillospiraceae bacterium]|nr:DHHW family protein [Oscillospiraceae bacterium]